MKNENITFVSKSASKRTKKKYSQNIILRASLKRHKHFYNMHESISNKKVGNMHAKIHKLIIRDKKNF